MLVYQVSAYDYDVESKPLFQGEVFETMNEAFIAIKTRVNAREFNREGDCLVIYSWEWDDSYTVDSRMFEALFVVVDNAWVIVSEEEMG